MKALTHWPEEIIIHDNSYFHYPLHSTVTTHLKARLAAFQSKARHILHTTYRVIKLCYLQTHKSPPQDGDFAANCWICTFAGCHTASGETSKTP